MVAIMVVGGVSGGHVNPAVTLAFAISGGISWIKVPIYWLAQFFGGYLGAGLAYWLYSSKFHIKIIHVCKNWDEISVYVFKKVS